MRVHVTFWTDVMRSVIQRRDALAFEIRAKQLKQTFNCCFPGLFDDCLQLEHLVDVVEDGEGGDEGDVHHPVVDLEKILKVNFANPDEKNWKAKTFSMIK